MAEKDDKKKPGDPAPQTGAPVKSKKKLLLIAGIGVVAVALVGVGVFTFLNKKGKPAGDNAAAAETAKAEEKGKEGGHGGKEGAAAASRYLTLDPFILNLADVESNRYLKISVSIEFADPRTIKEAEGKVPVIRDALVLLMSSLTYGEIHSVEGKITLQSEIQNRLGKILETGAVKRVYFTDLVVQ